MLMSVCAIIGMGNSAHIFLLQHLKRKQRIKWMMGVKKKKIDVIYYRWGGNMFGHSQVLTLTLLCKVHFNTRNHDK